MEDRLIQEQIDKGSVQHYKEELKSYINKKLKENDNIKYLIYRLHLFKRCNPSELLGAVRHRFETLEDMQECISYCVEKGLVIWSQEDGEEGVFITTISDSNSNYGYRYPDVLKHRDIKDYYLNTLYQIPLKLNPFSTQLRETKIEYKRFNLRVKEGYHLIGNRTIYIDWKYDYRGRAYANQYYINPCGTSFNKSMFLIPEKE